MRRSRVVFLFVKLCIAVLVPSTLFRMGVQIHILTSSQVDRKLCVTSLPFPFFLLILIADPRWLDGLCTKSALTTVFLHRNVVHGQSIARATNTSTSGEENSVLLLPRHHYALAYIAMDWTGSRERQAGVQRPACQDYYIIRTVERRLAVQTLSCCCGVFDSWVVSALLLPFLGSGC